MSITRPLYTIVDPTSLSGEDNICPICKDKYGFVVSGDCPVRVRCGHAFGKDCLRLWLEDRNGANASYPLCRTPLDDIRYNAAASLRRLAALRSGEQAGQPVTLSQVAAVLRGLTPYIAREVYAELALQRRQQREQTQLFERAEWLNDRERRAFRAQEQLRRGTEQQAREEREDAAAHRTTVRLQAQEHPHHLIEDPAHVEQQTVIVPRERPSLPGFGRKALAIACNMITALSRDIAWMPSDTVATIANLNFNHHVSHLREDGIVGSPRAMVRTRTPITGITSWYTASQSP